MAHTLLVLGLNEPKDVIRARQRARQIAGLLGYSVGEQASLAATVFYLADQFRRESVAGSLVFSVDDGCLRVVPLTDELFHLQDAADILSLCPSASSLKLEMALPARDDCLPPLDVVWAARQLEERTPLNVFEEMRRQNQELLAMHLELQASLKELARFRKNESSEPAA